MKYIVISPKNKLICFDDATQVTAYCMEKDTGYLDKFCEDQQLSYDNMTPVEIGYAYAAIGAQSGGCRVYELGEIEQSMKSEAIEKKFIEETIKFLNSEELDREVECPGYLEDVVANITPVSVSSLSGNIYIGQNIDSASDERGNSGI